MAPSASFRFIDTSHQSAGHDEPLYKSLNTHTPPNTEGVHGNGGARTNGNSNSMRGLSDSFHEVSLDRHTNGTPAKEDEFLKLSSPQQDILMLHGPRQKYSLEQFAEIPELRDDDEILVQVLCIGLNPVDWKGNDYGFGQPSYPWVCGRDFAGIVVKSSKSPGRVQQGDVVFGPSTDYRDVRKAAYQEKVQVLGVAFTAAAIALGVSLGVDFTTTQPAGPDFLGQVRRLDPRDVPEDIRVEISNGISRSDGPRAGDWFAIWGANTTTGRLALQLAKLAGLKVACVADLAKGGSQLSQLGTDFMVDKHDPKRAVEIIRAVTGSQLRFGLDCTGKETAEYLQQALLPTATAPKAHLVGLTGLPKYTPSGVVHHKVPIKLLHEAPVFGESLMRWLEELLVADTLRLPEVETADGGLAGINDALDRLRSGTVSGKRIVVPVGTERRSSPSTIPPTPQLNGSNGSQHSGDDLAYHDSINNDPDRLKFAYWVPNVSGGLVISKIPQRTNWDIKSNIRYAQTAERVGFEYALSQIRFMAGYGADNQHESVTTSHALLSRTARLNVLAALLPGPWNPALAAKQIASIDNFCDGRVAVMVVSGWFKLEFTSIGHWWLDHAEPYRRSREFIDCLKGIWTEEKFTYQGDFYQFHDYPLKPKPLSWPGRPHPEIFQGGNSNDAQEIAAQVSDYYFMNGNTLEGFQTQIASVREKARAAGREGQVKFALNAFVICRSTEAEAHGVLAEIQGKADKEAVEGFRQQVQNAGASSGDKKGGMWADSKFEDLVQYNDGFKTKLIGTKEQIAERICF
ncbi:hypothetical protein LTR62_005691 [Meristemomyces frigidus]|uniref:Luciferase-like domain-containing protein n=1 Tax=Meristemomyces frigidus TaxID=1508187 RepID=A0AAN7TF54_9PEZI|nr:hypothetical protein LTR62_005691 [Meristemomyces frigidus]